MNIKLDTTWKMLSRVLNTQQELFPILVISTIILEVAKNNSWKRQFYHLNRDLCYGFMLARTELDLWTVNTIFKTPDCRIISWYHPPTLVADSLATHICVQMSTLHYLFLFTPQIIIHPLRYKLSFIPSLKISYLP